MKNKIVLIVESWFKDIPYFKSISIQQQCFSEVFYSQSANLIKIEPIANGYWIRLNLTKLKYIIDFIVKYNNEKWVISNTLSLMRTG